MRTAFVRSRCRSFTVFRAIGLDFASRFCGLASWKSMHSFVRTVPRTRSKALQDAFYASEERAPHLSLAFLPSLPVAHAVLRQRKTAGGPLRLLSNSLH